MIGAIFDFIIEYLFFYTFDNEKTREKNNTIFISLLLFTAYGAFATIFYYSWHYYLIGFFVMSVFYRNISQRKNLFFTFLYAGCHSAINLLIAYIIDAEHFRIDFNNIIFFILLKEIQLLIFLIIAHTVRYYKTKQGSEFKRLLLFFFPLIYTAVITVTKAYSEPKSIYTILCSNIIILSISLYLYISSNSKEIEKEESYDFDKQYIQVLEEQVTTLSHLLHDTKNHYSVIKMFETTDEVKDYVNKISGELTSEGLVLFTGNKVLDILLNKYKTSCEEKGITFYADIHTSNLKYVDDRILTGLISNLLDNAITAAEKSQDKEIKIYMQNHNDLDILIIDNSCDNYYGDDNFPTVKRDYKMHGHGMHLIKKYCNQIGADYSCQFSKEKHLFKTTIIFHR